MPCYCFVDEATGEPVEHYLPMAEAPRIGDVVEIEGRRLRRLVSPLQYDTENLERWRFESISAPPWAPGAPSYNPESGAPRFSSRAQVREFLARNQDGPNATLGWTGRKP